TDASAKLSGAPTFEVRVSDCASSRRFLAEHATFIAAFVQHRGTQPVECRLTPEEYRDCMTNRWSAARHGLQATFQWEGRPRPVVDVLDEMLDECGEELRALGATPADLGVVSPQRRTRNGERHLTSEL